MRYYRFIAEPIAATRSLARNGIEWVFDRRKQRLHIYIYTRGSGKRCVGEKLLYEGGRSDRWVLHPVSCRRIIRADKSQRNTLYRWGWGACRWDERGADLGWFWAKLKVRIANGGRGLEIACRCPITRTDLASPIVAVPTFDFGKGENRPSPPFSPPPCLCHLLHQRPYPSTRPICHCHGPSLLLFRVISLSDNDYVSL